MAFKPLLPPTTSRPKSEILRYSPAAQISNLVSKNFHCSTLLLAGALCQGLLVLAIPRIGMLLPTIAILFVRFADTLAVTFKFRANPYLEDAIFQKWSPIIPDADGNMSDHPADEKVAVLLLCLKLNHPLGFFAPKVKKIADFSEGMAFELDAGAPHNGFLGQSEWHTTDVKGASEILLLSYWRSIDDIHNYSQSPLHKEAWAWWDQMVHKEVENMKHIGIDHEIFEAPRSRWEKVSINFQPTRLGATSYLRKGDKMMGGTVDDQWISPVVEARGKLRTSHGRLNWASSVSRSDSGDERY